MKATSIETSDFLGIEAGSRPEANNSSDAQFEDALLKSISALDSSQQAADQQAKSLALGSGRLHETALALEKADIVMHVAMKVRNKLVDAYHEVMRMTS